MRAFNLIPADERGGGGPGAGKSGGGAYVVLGLLGVLAIFAVLYGSASHEITTEQSQVATLTAQAQRAQAEAVRLAPYTSFMAMEEQRTQAVDQLVDSRFDWAHAFHELGRVLPRNASISSLSGAIGSTTTTGSDTTGAAATGAAATRAAASSAATTSSAPTIPSAAGATTTQSTAVASATPPGSVPIFTLSGCATSQTEVASTLDRLRLIDGVSEVTLQSSTGASGSSVSSSGGGGGCVGKDPAFAMQATFEPLPTPSATVTTSTTATASTGAATAADQPATATGGAR